MAKTARDRFHFLVSVVDLYGLDVGHRFLTLSIIKLTKLKIASSWAIPSSSFILKELVRLSHLLTKTMSQSRRCTW